MLEQDCKFKQYDNKFKCEYCGYESKYMAKRNCPALVPNMPSQLQRIINFSAAASQHAIAGNPVVSEDVLKERLAICKSCPLFKPNENEVGGVCAHSSCGCNIKDNLEYLNKLAWADQECPIHKWGAVNKQQNGV